MPKQTFYNISQAKKEKLIDAAKKEFSRAPLNEALISNIVKEAGISRGSFYQYFEDKEDLYFYLLDEHARENKENFIISLKKLEGDIFSAFIEMYQSMLQRFKDKENRDFFKNAFLNMNYKVENTFTKTLKEKKCNNNDKLQEVMQLINKDKLKITDEKELHHMFQILMAVTFHNLIQNFAKELPNQDSMEKFILEMELLKRGLAKDEHASNEAAKEGNVNE